LSDYRVQLDVYNGPLDLLLYLIRKEEVDIYDIPIARITEQYLEYLEVLKALDVDLAGEFLVLAATLMEIKSRMLLPHPPPLEEGQEEDPRAELVRELLEYQKYREAAEELKERAEEQKLKYPRLARPELPEEEEPSVPLQEVELWDVFAAFRKLMKETMGRVPRTIVYDDIPVSEFMERLVARVSALRSPRFWELFAERRDRMYVVGTFLALLELIRRRILWAVQKEPFGDILIQLRPGGGPENLKDGQWQHQVVRSDGPPPTGQGDTQSPETAPTPDAEANTQPWGFEGGPEGAEQGA